MSVTIHLAGELNIDPQIAVDTAREMITTSDQKVLTVEYISNPGSARPRKGPSVERRHR